MSICYIILTCEKYLPTRGEWQKDTWLKKIGQDAYYFLSAKPDSHNRVLGWNTDDDYKSAPVKYIEFFKNTRQLLSKYDWIVMCDDDTYIYHNRLSNYLKAFNPQEKIYIGYQWNHQPIPYMSGGAGFVLSATLYNELCDYAQKKPMKNDYYSDLSIGWWINDIGGVRFINDEHFSPWDHTQAVFKPNNTYTYHYVTENLFRYYDTFT